MAAKVYKIIRKDGTKSPMWYGRPHVNGKRTQRAFSIYQKVAQDRLDEMNKVSKAHRRGEPIFSDISLGHFRELYLKFSVNKRKKKTHDFNKQMFELIDKYLFLQQLRQMTPERLEALDHRLKEDNWPPVSAVRLIRGIKTAMRWAEKRGFPMQNWGTVELNEPAAREDFYEQDAYGKLLSQLSGNDLTSIWIMGHLGLRLSELFFLEWSNVQFENRRVIFRSKPHLGFTIKGEKKRKLTREIPLTIDKKLEHYLQSIARPEGFVLSEDRFANPDSYGRHIRKILAATKIKTYLGKDGSAHTLRHTFGSHLAQMGVDLQRIQKLMGHASIRMTQVYSHLTPTDLTPIEFKGFETCMETTQNLCTNFVPLDSHEPSGLVSLKQDNEEFGSAEISTETTKNRLIDGRNNTLGR